MSEDKWLFEFRCPHCGETFQKSRGELVDSVVGDFYAVTCPTIGCQQMAVTPNLVSALFSTAQKIENSLRNANEDIIVAAYKSIPE